MVSTLPEKVWLAEALPLSDQPSSSTSSFKPIDPLVQQKLLWKIDRHLVPILFVLFLAAFIEYSKIASARMKGSLLTKLAASISATRGYKV